MTEQQTEHNMLMEFIQHESRVDVEKELEYPPVALSYGEKLTQTPRGDTLLPIPLGTFGNLSVVSAPPKTKKTFFISLLASVFLSGENNYGGKIKGHRGDGDLIHFDTEQGLWHCQNVFKRVFDMDSNVDKKKYHTFGLRTTGVRERLMFIEYYLKQKIKSQSLVIIDGIADLCMDVNNIEESNQLIQELMRMSTQYNVHILSVIHQNYGSDKMTGHLGSYLAKKVETHIELEANTVNRDWVTVKCKRSRGYSFETFSFTVNNYGLPHIVDNIYDPLK
jgi:hypothetical protein